jgi:Ca2+-binding RTX toxin-like protein
VHVDLTTGRGSKGFAEGDVYVSIENIQGSRYSDRLRGDNNTNVIDGGEGNDHMDAEGGDDVVYALVGNNRVFGGDGNDLILLGFGSNEVDGGKDNDTISYQFARGGIKANLTSGIVQVSLLHEDKVRNVEHVTGTNFDDTLEGDDNDNTLAGLDGNDDMRGRGGKDVFVLGAGNNTIDGGTDKDILVYEKLGSGITVVMAIGIATAKDKIDKFKNVENIFGTRFDDKISGDQFDNYLDGHDGDDDIDGADGNDVIAGGTGNNTLKGSDGNDVFLVTDGGFNVIDGGSGRNGLDYHMLSTGVNVSLIAGITYTVGVLIDQYKNIAVVVGTPYADHIVGDRDNNIFDGNDGDDYISGGGANDQITGGAGYNILFGDDGNDKFFLAEGSNKVHGGSGRDTASYQSLGEADYEQVQAEYAMRKHANLLPQYNNQTWQDFTELTKRHGVIVNLETGTAYKAHTQLWDNITSIELVIGTHYIDEITGNDEDNFLNGVDGDDAISGKGGRDIIIVGRGYSRLAGGDGDDLFAIQRDGEADVDGGDGLDVLDLATHTCSIYASLRDGVIKYCSGQPRKISGIESIRTGDRADKMLDSDGDDTISTEDGNDEIYLTKGNDIADASTGDDTVHIQWSGTKKIAGGPGADTFVLYGIQPGTSANITILDFTSYDGDKLDVSHLPDLNFSGITYTQIKNPYSDDVIVHLTPDHNLILTAPAGDLPVLADFIFAE